MFDLAVEFGTRSTKIAVRSGSLAEVGSVLRAVPGEAAVEAVFMVTDSRVGALYGKTVFESLRGAGYRAAEHRVEAGEASKQLAVLGDLYDALARAAIGRDGLVLAVGGGVVSDLAGLAAATWMRGVRFAICPTTLEADIDAAIGGKTAINIAAGKNLVGAFHQPVFVLIDPSCLRTLDARDLRAGLAESVKHALIDSEEFLAWHEANAESILSHDESTVRELILRNVRVKAAIVEQDARETSGARMLLNLGHTIGHAIESVCGYHLRHGECVALGLVAACRLSNRLGMLDEGVTVRVISLLDRLGLPTRLANPVSATQILGTMRMDKKARTGRLQLVLLTGAGSARVHGDVSSENIREAIESLSA